MSPSLPNNTAPELERLYTIKDAAELLGLRYWKLLRAVNRGDIKSYTLLNSRKMVRLSEIISVMEEGNHE